MCFCEKKLKKEITILNIKDAKTQIHNSLKSYLAKDADGHYLIPAHEQRPVFLMGPPGIGKTAIMEQIASEMNVALLSYSMTHHTRQSALGLPFIQHKVYDGKEYDISEYTMSEIISSIYELQEETGAKEGILFLDEINCVSETLAPVMLQFLQYKIFGKHKVPDGWIVVTAGNPPEYNKSVREFDIATWDRLKRIDVTPDFDTWKDYAYATHVHPAIITYLENKHDNFYTVRSTENGKQFVTARGWGDLSKIMHVYESLKLNIDNDLIGQYLQDIKIARDFESYYELFKKYKSDYKINSILEGNVDPSIKTRASQAQIDERLSLTGLVLDAIMGEITETHVDYLVIETTFNLLKKFKSSVNKAMASDSAREILNNIVSEAKTQNEKDKKAGKISMRDVLVMEKAIKIINDIQSKFTDDVPKNTMKVARKEFDKCYKAYEKKAEKIAKRYDNAQEFIKTTFADGTELIIFLEAVTTNSDTSQFLSRDASAAYNKYNDGLMLTSRQAELDKEIDNIDLDSIDADDDTDN